MKTSLLEITIHPTLRPAPTQKVTPVPPLAALMLAVQHVDLPVCDTVQLIMMTLLLNLLKRLSAYVTSSVICYPLLHCMFLFIS